MTGDRLASLSLRVDGLYCLALGLVVAVAAPFAASAVTLSPVLLAGVGAATVLWGWYVWRSATRLPVRASVRVVMVANVVASLGLAVTGVVAGTVVLASAAFALSVDVAAFAASQAIALRRIRAES